MKKTKTCFHCTYSREPGPTDTDIPGIGNWCSNSKSPKWRTRVKGNDGCLGFTQRGKKAPLALRLGVKGMRVVNGLLNWREKRRKKK